MNQIYILQAVCKDTYIQNGTSVLKQFNWV